MEKNKWTVTPEAVKEFVDKVRSAKKDDAKVQELLRKMRERAQMKQ